MNGSLQVYYGEGRGKTTAVLGLGIRAAGMGRQVIMVQFLKEKKSGTLELLKRLEPELKVFRFEKGIDSYDHLSEAERQEQLGNIRTALSYSKKVLDTAQCDLLILDDIFGLIEYGIMTEDELVDLISYQDESMRLIMTGRHLPDKIREMADCIYVIHTDKENNADILSV